MSCRWILLRQGIAIDVGGCGVPLQSPSPQRGGISRAPKSIEQRAQLGVDGGEGFQHGRLIGLVVAGFTPPQLAVGMVGWTRTPVLPLVGGVVVVMMTRGVYPLLTIPTCHASTTGRL